MKAKDLLKEIVKAYPDVVAIAQDENGSVYIYSSFIPITSTYIWRSDGYCEPIPCPKIIEWDSENWKENIITINDLNDDLN